VAGHFVDVNFSLCLASVPGCSYEMHADYSTLMLQYRRDKNFWCARNLGAVLPVPSCQRLLVNARDEACHAPAASVAAHACTSAAPHGTTAWTTRPSCRVGRQKPTIPVPSLAHLAPSPLALALAMHARWMLSLSPPLLPLSISPFPISTLVLQTGHLMWRLGCLRRCCRASIARWTQRRRVGGGAAVWRSCSAIATCVPACSSFKS
jgi:hypothetical protein